MSRMTDDGRHEGAIEFVFADGMSGSGWSSGLCSVTIAAADGKALAYENWQYRTDSEVVSWRANCTDCTDSQYRHCWTGPTWTRVATEAEQDRSERRVFSEDSMVSDEVEGWIMADWERHIAQHEPAYPIPRPAVDPRFNLGLAVEVAGVLAEHGYPEIAAGADLVRLQQALFTFLYES